MQYIPSSPNGSKKLVIRIKCPDARPLQVYDINVESDESNSSTLKVYGDYVCKEVTIRYEHDKYSKLK